MDKAARAALLTAKGMDSKSENIADYVADLLRQGRAKEVTDDLMAQADPQRLMHHYKSGNTGMDLPMDQASRMARAAQMGLTENTIHGTATGKDFSAFKGADRYGSRLGQENYVAPNTEEGRKLAAQFSTSEQGRIMPLFTPKPLDTRNPDDRARFEQMMDEKNRLDDFRMNGGYSASGLPSWGKQWAIDTANEAGVPAMKLHERDWVTSDAVFDPTKMRSQFARFDPRLDHLAHLSASTGGAMDFARHVEAVQRAGGQIAPSKYLPNVPRAVHAGGGKVAFMQGNHPLVPDVLYHGTARDIKSFDPDAKRSYDVDPSNPEETDTGWFGKGHYFTASPKLAAHYANEGAKRQGGQGASIIPAHVAMKNPFVVDMKAYDSGAKSLDNAMSRAGVPMHPRGWRKPSEQTAALVGMGYDGVIATREGKPEEYVAFHPTQIKSAIGNQGTFDPNDPDITKDEGGEVDDDGITAYHGSPHDFDQFDISKLGTGEGNQSYGHGLYFAGNENIAKYYRDMLAPRVSGNSALHTHNGDIDAAIAEANQRISNYEAMEPSRTRDGLLQINKQKLLDLTSRKAGNGPLAGHMYKVKLNVKPHELLDWDKPLSEQHPNISDKINNVVRLTQGERERLPIRSVLELLGDPKTASEKLSAAGIKGIRYLDASSRGNDTDGDPTHNYVMFHHDPVQVVDKYEYGGAIPKAHDVSAALALTRRFTKDGTGATMALKPKGK